MAAKRFPNFNVNLSDFSPAQQLQLTALTRQLVLLREAELVTRVYTDTNRPDPGEVGKVIFNTTDGQLNIDDGTNWTLPDGTTT